MAEPVGGFGIRMAKKEAIRMDDFYFCVIATLKMNPRLVGAASINYKIKHVSEKMSSLPCE